MRHQRGFTLLEILVVVFIIGIILSFATLNLGGRALDDRAEEEVRRLQAIFELARDEAGLTGFQLGWLADEERYQFLALQESGWAQYAERGPFRARPLEKPFRIKLQVEDFSIGADDEAQQISPQIIFFSSGEVTPFSLQLSAPQLDVIYKLSGNLLGQISLERIDRDELPFS